MKTTKDKALELAQLIEDYKGEFYGVYEFESKKSKTSCSK